MRIGINLPTTDGVGHALDARALRERARLAEEAGVDGIWIDDLIEPGVWHPDPTAWLLPAAAATSRVELGILDFAMAAREPVESAHEFVSLQALSDLRLTVGIEGDVRCPVLAGHDPQRSAKLHEHADVVRRLANGEVVGDASLETWPKVRGTLRLALGAAAEDLIVRAARDYDAWIACADDTALDDLEARLATYRAASGSRAIATVRVGLAAASARVAELAPYGFDDVVVMAGDWGIADDEALRALARARG